MSRPRNVERVKAVQSALVSFLTVTLIAIGASLCLCDGLLHAHGAVLPVVILCASMALVCALYRFFVCGRVHPMVRIIVWALVLISLTVWGIAGGGPVHEIIQLARALVLTLAGDSGVMAVYAARARVVICLLVTLLMSYAASDGEFAPAAALFMAMTVPVCASFDRDMALRLMPGVAGLMLLLASHGGKRLVSALLAILLAFGGLFLLPPAGTTSPPLAETAEDIREFIEDYLMYDDVRTAFSLETDGYLPLSSRLGGEAHPSDRSVMEVTTDRVVRLRATAQDMYSGAMWYDTLSSRRYLYVSPGQKTLRDALFDISLPRDYADAPAMATVKIHMLADATTSLYMPQRVRQIEVGSDRMVLYFNTASELFITRDLTVGDEYTVEYIPFRVGDGATERLIEAGARTQDAHYAEVAAQYLTVPSYMQDAVYSIVTSAVGGATTPYQTARNIEDYLSSRYWYALNVAEPPENVDFVTWFLLGEEKAGYCTYFATAMTLLCRMAGLPARYVTGYLVTPEESGVSLVTGRDAHAWTEVYLNGFGWLPFDATPDRQDDHGETPPPPPSDPSPSPTPTPLPTPTPTPTPPPPEEGDAPSPSPTPESDERDTAPTPTPAPAEPPAREDEREKDFLWLVLFGMLFIALLILRYLATEPTRRAARHPAQAAMIYYAAVRDIFVARGIVRRRDETLYSFAARAEESGLPMPVMPLIEAVSSEVYGRGAHYTAAQAQEFKLLYIACKKSLHPVKRVFVAIKRMFTFDLSALPAILRRRKNGR